MCPRTVDRLDFVAKVTQQASEVRALDHSTIQQYQGKLLHKIKIRDNGAKQMGTTAPTGRLSSLMLLRSSFMLTLQYAFGGRRERPQANRTKPL